MISSFTYSLAAATMSTATIVVLTLFAKTLKRYLISDDANKKMLLCLVVALFLGIIAIYLDVTRIFMHQGLGLLFAEGVLLSIGMVLSLIAFVRVGVLSKRMIFGYFISVLILIFMVFLQVYVPGSIENSPYLVVIVLTAYTYINLYYYFGNPDTRTPPMNHDPSV